MRKLLCVALALVAAAPSALAFMLPPIARPDWWRTPNDPAEGLVRTQYRSFITDPMLRIFPDYNYDTYATPLDSYTWPCGLSRLNHWIGRHHIEWGDGYALYLEADGVLSKWMWNARVDHNVKRFYAVYVWTTRAWIEQGILPLRAPEITIDTETGSTITDLQQDYGRIMNPTGMPGDWWYSIVTGWIRPQPCFERFHFRAIEDAYIDSMWAGTRCVPEPLGWFALALGATFLASRRRTG